MPDIFRALFKIFWKLRFKICFEFFVAVSVNTIPELRLSIVKVVNGVQVHVFLMPAKHRFP
jgi:hypothetical protein